MPVHLATHLNEADTRAQLIDPQVNRTWQDKTLRLETQDKLEQAR